MTIDPAYQTIFYFVVGGMISLSGLAFHVCRFIMRRTPGAVSWIAFVGVLASTVVCSGSIILMATTRFDTGEPWDGRITYPDQPTTSQTPGAPQDPAPTNTQQQQQQQQQQPAPAR